MKLKLSIPVLLAGILLSLFFIGCGTVINKFMPESEYEAPALPKSELATIQVDTERGWLQRYNLIVFRIDGKLALRKNIEAYEEIAIDEILVTPGKHDMSVMTIHGSFFDEGTRGSVQTTTRFSADVKAGSTYLLRDTSELVDADTDKVVSKSKLF